MSVSIATMGKFWPSGTTIINKIDGGGGGSSSGYGWDRPKPKIIISGVSDEDERDFMIRVTKVTEWS